MHLLSPTRPTSFSVLLQNLTKERKTIRRRPYQLRKRLYQMEVDTVPL